MKVCVIQPPYSMDPRDTERLFGWYLNALDACDASMDIIVLPEYSNCPCSAETRQELFACISRTTPVLRRKACDTAKRCRSILFVNMALETPYGLRNTTIAYNRSGREVGYYYKQHPTAGELRDYHMDSTYACAFSEPTVLTIEGLRFGFLTCYDTYFYELFSNIARQNVDIIISCSYMRSDPHHVLALLNSFCCYNCNAYMLRASVSMGADSPVGGCSMVAAPDGTLILDMKNRVGLGCAEIDPKQKYYKSAGFGNPPAAHYAYVEVGRRPWKYRPAGSAIVCDEKRMPYPRLCAWDGYQPALAADSMAAYGAAIAHDVQELGFALSIRGDELMAGSVPLEQLLRKFSCHAILQMETSQMNLTVEVIRALVTLLHRYDCKDHVYLLSSDPAQLRTVRQAAPELVICLAADDCDTAICLAGELGCQKLQLPYITPQQAEQIHRAGMHCNVLAGETGDTFVLQNFSDYH